MSRRRSAFFTPLVLSLVLLIAACGGGVFAPGQADRGIGGTGIGVADRGIGGTGIVGTVTAFGSVWVNGLRVELPTSAQLRIEGQPATVDDVRIGQVIAVTAAAGGPTGLTARVLDVRYAVAGPVERVAGEAAIILGQKIEIGSALGRDALAPGAWVAVSGLRRPDGVIVAGRIDPWSSARGWLLRGRLEAVTPEMIRVSGLAVGRAALTGADVDALLAADGGTVRIAGARLGQASSVTADPINPFGAAVGALSVETFTDATGAVADGLLEDSTSLGPFAPSSRIVIDSVVRRGGSGGGDARAFGAPGLGGREAPDGDPAARAAGLGRGRDSGPPGAGDPGVGLGPSGAVGVGGAYGEREAPNGAPPGAGSPPGAGPPGAGPPGAGPPGGGPPGRGGPGRGPPGFGGDPRGGRSPGGTSVGGAGLEGRGVR
ncbi:DUF5666 domain-containing protein [Azospirillum cavernae]|uniref:DUF5666 domain-containing protein n=1 Tax=Azospirillum cavernae TaxID=2320860 RepID=UPI001314AE9C|nr:DUF5666 domain-containing protein [Azospirillum cavernae]